MAFREQRGFCALGVLMPRPEYIIWIFTARCNLDCKHCYTYRLRGKPELPLEEKLRIAKSIGEEGVEYVNLTGGEPLIHPHFRHILLALHEHGVEKSVVTNATIVREDVAELLYRTETYVFASIEGPREVHDAVRGPGSYDAAVRGVELLRRKVGPLTIVATVNKINHQRVHEVVDYAASVDAEGVAVLPVMPVGRARETGIYVTASEYLGALRRVYERALEYGLNVSAWCTPFAPVLGMKVGYWFCRGMTGMDVDPSGDVLLCDVLDFKVTSVVGKSIREAFEEFSNHELVKKVRSPAILPINCSKCPIVWGCRGGCYARAYLLRGDLNAGDPLCPRSRV